MKRLWLVRQKRRAALSPCTAQHPLSPRLRLLLEQKASSPPSPDFSKNALVGDTVAFSDQDFSVQNGDGIKLTSITITALPDQEQAL